jgi:hypothetical protein
MNNSAVSKTLRTVILGLLGAILLSCAQTSSGPDYRNEVGADGLLTPRAVFARYVDALGGESVIRSHSSRTQSGTFLLSSFGMSGSMTMKTAAPNLILQEIELGGLGTINSGYNGEVAWASDPLQGMQRLTGQTLADMARQAEYYMPLTYAAVFPEQETVGQTQVNGEEAYELILTDSDGGETQVYFSTETGFMIRTIATISSPVGAMRTVTDLHEYAEFDGEYLPVALTVDQGGQQFEIQIESVTFNDVSASDFVAPSGL